MPFPEKLFNPLKMTEKVKDEKDERRDSEAFIFYGANAAGILK